MSQLERKRRLVVNMITGCCKLPKGSDVMWGEEGPEFTSEDLREVFLSGNLTVEEAAEMFRRSLTNHVAVWRAEADTDKLKA